MLGHVPEGLGSRDATEASDRHRRARHGPDRPARSGLLDHDVHDAYAESDPYILVGRVYEWVEVGDEEVQDGLDLDDHHPDVRVHHAGN